MGGGGGVSLRLGRFGSVERGHIALCQSTICWRRAWSAWRLGERGWFEALMFGVEGGLSFPYFLDRGSSPRAPAIFIFFIKFWWDSSLAELRKSVW